MPSIYVGNLAIQPVFWSSPAITNLTNAEDTSVFTVPIQFPVDISQPFSLNAGNADLIIAVQYNGKTLTKVIGVPTTDNTWGVYQNNLWVKIKAIASPSFSITKLNDYDGKIFTNRWPISGLQVLDQLNCLGELTINYDFESPSKATMTIGIHKSNLDLFVNNWQKNSTIISLLGRDYLINNYTINELNEKEYTSKLLTIDIDLVSKWESIGDPSRCSLDFPYTQPIQDKYGFKTLREEYEETAVINNGFVYYGSDIAPQIRQFGNTTVHKIFDYEILNPELNFSQPGCGTVIDGINLTKEYRYTRLNYNTPAKTNTEKLLKTQRIETENCLNKTDAMSPIYTPSVGNGKLYAEELSNPDNCFDTGGRTKTIREITEANGSSVKVIETIYGYVFTSFETYQIQTWVNNGSQQYKEKFGNSIGAPPSPFQFWKPVEISTTTYKYDSKGWLINVTKITQKRTRIKQESSGIEQVKAWIKYLYLSSIPILSPTSTGVDPSYYEQNQQLAIKVNQIFREFQAYKYNWTYGISDITNYVLENMEDYYQDLKDQKKQTTDPNYYSPQYARKTIRKSLNNEVVPDPANNAADPFSPFPNALKRSEYTEIQENIIVIPSGNVSSPEKFRSLQYNFSAQGEGGKNKLEIGSSTENNGRPSTHTRLELPTNSSSGGSIAGPPKITLSYTPPIPKLSSGGVTGGVSSWSSVNGSETQVAKTTKLLSQNAIPDNANNGIKSKAEEGSISFNTKYLSKAFLGAQTKLSIENTKTANTITLETRVKPLIAEGDLVDWRGKLWLVISISITISIEKKNTYNYTKFILKLGQLLNVPIAIA